MTNADPTTVLIALLLPLAAAMVITQKNPYYALVLRGILGAIAALVYTVLGAADVALTEALVGTLLAIMLYAIAVRSSMVVRVGVLKEEMPTDPAIDPPATYAFEQVMSELHRIFQKHFLRVDVKPYLDAESLWEALLTKELHLICTHAALPLPNEPEAALAPPAPPPPTDAPYRTTTRLRRIYEILQAELDPHTVALNALTHPPTPEAPH